MKLFPVLVTLLASSLATTILAAADDTRPISRSDAIAIARDGNDTRAAQAVAAERAKVAVVAAEGADDLVIDAAVEGLTRSTEPSTGPFFQETDVGAVSARVGVW